MYNEEKMCVPENYEIGQEPLSAIIDRHDCLIVEALTMVKKIKMICQRVQATIRNA